MNYTAIFRNHARNRPAHPAIIDAQGHVLYRELDGLTTAIARRLRTEGIKAGDLIGVALPNSAEHLLLLCGLVRLGAAALPLDPAWPAADIADRLQKFDSTWLIVPPDGPSPKGVRRIVADGSWRQATPAEAVDGEFPDDNSQPAFLVLSSGTTGLPKAVMMTHGQLRERLPVVQMNLGFGPRDRYATVIPLAFNIGRVNCLNTLQTGGTVVVFGERLPIERLPETLRRNRITWTFLTPMHLRRLLQLPERDRPLMPFLRQLQVGSSTLTAEERAAARRRIAPNFFESYGSNECGLFAVSSPADQARRPDSVGRVIVGVEAEIVDDSHRPLPAGKTGRIRLRGPGFSAGYFRNPEATAEAFRDGWFYPGDLAVIDDEGYIHLKGRGDDVINFDGVKIVPDEVEAVLRTHPAVAEAAVVGHQNPARREFPVAFVVLRGAATPDELGEFCKTRLAVPQQPRAFFIIDALPKNELGKVLRRALREKIPDLKPRQR